jgi:hypothetical protein
MTNRAAGRTAAAMMLLVSLAIVAPRVVSSQAQGGAPRGTIQDPSGGPGPGAAPGAKDPANAAADLSPKPPVLPLSPQDEVKQFWLPAGYRMEPSCPSR